MLRCRVVLGALLAALTVVAVAPGEAQAAPHSSTFTVNRRDSDLGGSFRFAGSVPTAPAGKAVVLEVFSAGRWQTAALTRTNSARSYVVFYRAPRVGNFPMRLRVPASNGRSTQVSPSITVSVFRWLFLTEQRELAPSGERTTGPAQVNGVTFYNSLSGSANSRKDDVREFDIGRRCVAFKSTFGVPDDTRSTNRIALSVRVDGVVKFQQTFQLGRPAAVSVPLNGALRLALHARSMTNFIEDFVYGDAMIRCMR